MWYHPWNLKNCFLSPLSKWLLKLSMHHSRLNFPSVSFHGLVVQHRKHVKRNEQPLTKGDSEAKHTQGTYYKTNSVLSVFRATNSFKSDWQEGSTWERWNNLENDSSRQQREVLSNSKSFEANSPLQVELTDKVRLMTEGNPITTGYNLTQLQGRGPLFINSTNWLQFLKAACPSWKGWSRFICEALLIYYRSSRRRSSFGLMNFVFSAMTRKDINITDGSPLPHPG